MTNIINSMSINISITSTLIITVIIIATMITIIATAMTNYCLLAASHAPERPGALATGRYTIILLSLLYTI